MSVPFGVDLGNYNSVIACARNRGIDIIVNEVSNRATPSIVGFGPKNRFIGETGKNQQGSNLKNTAENLKRILGLKFNDPDVEIEKKFFTCPLVEAEDGGVAVKVKYLGKDHTFNAAQLEAMYLDKLKETAAFETKGNITDICLSVPVWYNVKQRQAAAEALRIAGLNPVRIVNELTAAAVGYGVFKQNDLPEDEPKIVAFVDIGHAQYSVAIASVKKGELKILGTAYNKHFGGRDLDLAIANHFAKEFKSKYKIDIHTNPKAFYRVLTAAEKIKKVLSANTQAPFNIESLMDDIDVSSLMTRDELEDYIQPLLDQVHVVVDMALNHAGVSKDQIDSIEVIGGCTRVPSIKEKLSEAFGKPLSFTLNQDEAIARGNAFICATHSPTVRVRPFKFEDANPSSVSYYWNKEEEDEDHLEVFPRGGAFPSTKMITLYRSGDFQVQAKYTDNELPRGIDTDLIATWNISGVQVSEGESSIATKLKLRNDPSGFYTIEQAFTVEEKIVKELIEKEVKEGEEEEGEEEAEPEYREVKKLVKKDDLTIQVADTGAYSDKQLNQYIEDEAKMVSTDKLVKDTEDRKNALEEYIYELRGKLEEQYAPFASDEEKTKLGDMLSKTENWLYDDGYDSTKGKYIAKYEELAAIGNVIKGRYMAKEEEKRQELRQKQEQKQAAAMAEKLAADRAANANKDAE